MFLKSPIVEAIIKYVSYGYECLVLIVICNLANLTLVPINEEKSSEKNPDIDYIYWALE